MVAMDLPVDYYSWPLHWVTCCGVEITDRRLIFIEQWVLVTTDDYDICGHFDSHRDLQFLLGNAGHPCLELE